MFVDPPAIAVTVPERLPTVATPALLLVHTPPVGVLVKVSADPAQMLVLPEIADGAAFTVIIVVLWQPVVVTLYVMIAVPALTPVIIPEVLLMVATVISPLLHVPPDVVLLNTADDPSHTVVVPVMVAGLLYTIIVVVRTHPAPSEYDIVAEPAVTPVTTPVEASMVAVDVLLLLHVPPDTGWLNVAVVPTHTVVGPVIAAGVALIVTTRVV